jgi:hypothetical protein
MPGHTYGSSEPTRQCPYCGEQCEAQFTDVGVGYEQTGPYRCNLCYAVEMGPFDEPERELTAEETRLRWYAPEFRFKYEFPPIPDRRFDWYAWRNRDDDENTIRGWGPSKEEALKDLLEKIED